MNERPAVGDVLGSDQLDRLPVGTIVECTSEDYRIVSVPEVDARTQLAEKLRNTWRNRSANVSDADTWLVLADMVLAEYTNTDLAVVIDGDGDTWYRADDGDYSNVENSATGFNSLGYIRRTYGIRSEQ